jgi:hypothetical protein
MDTPNYGFYIPDPSAVPSRKNWVEDPIMSVDTALAGVMSALGLTGQKVQHGTFVLGVGTTAADQAVTFAVPFSGAPRVFCTVIDTAAPSSATGHRSDRWGATAGDSGGSGTTTGFFFRSQRTTASANVRVNWWAIGPA